MLIPVTKRIRRTDTFIGQECASRSKAAFFTRKGRYVNWILYKIRQNLYVCQVPAIYRVLNYLPQNYNRGPPRSKLLQSIHKFPLKYICFLSNSKIKNLEDHKNSHCIIFKWVVNSISWTLQKREALTIQSIMQHFWVLGVCAHTLVWWIIAL